MRCDVWHVWDGGHDARWVGQYDPVRRHGGDGRDRRVSGIGLRNGRFGLHGWQRRLCRGGINPAGRRRNGHGHRHGKLDPGRRHSRNRRFRRQRRMLLRHCRHLCLWRHRRLCGCGVDAAGCDHGWRCSITSIWGDLGKCGDGGLCGLFLRHCRLGWNGRHCRIQE